MGALTEDQSVNEVQISVVIPVYQGRETLRPLIDAIAPLTRQTLSPEGRSFNVSEVILVDDCGPDRSGEVIDSLATEFTFVRRITLMRNYGEHAAVAAGITLTRGSWVLTIDEDFQHDPGQLGVVLDGAISAGADLAYGSSAQSEVHPRWRRAASTASKRLVKTLFGGHATTFCSYRLIEGERARAAASLMAYRTYLDVALTWTCGTVIEVPVRPGRELREHSGYSFSSLMSHFWMLILSSGVRPLRFVSALGATALVTAIVGSVIIARDVIWGDGDIQGWPSTFVVLLGSSGLILFALGIIAEYLGAVLSVARGRPAFVLRHKDDGDSTS